ncbi:hypothetical protein U5801_13645 [Lamprobacter modestohalophilus]|uniref:hypothetical protein n=1 Tax=Lamprobacter modestohalophilus TaxID=1064514 RepID=UPI002ADEB736|nr:hypothetical protein [Lamprobacter modestohalophilus]MEA1050843.1 hypothetical protein [Lamprobacter modestohalophilus]
MSTDFRDAALRHLDDAELLLNDNCIPNADQLFGLSAECSLKAVMVGLGLATHPDGTPQDYGHKVHMPDLWAAFQSFASGRLASRYLDAMDIQNPFVDWDVEQRYWNSSAIQGAATQNHHLAALQCIESLERLIADGAVH